MADRYESLDWAERWFADAFRVIEPPGGFSAIDVDMSRSKLLVEKLRAGGIRATYNHVVVRAAALALSRHPELHVMAAGNRRVWPERVDVGLSVAGETSYAPIMVLEDAGKKPLAALATEVLRRVPEVQAKEKKDLAGMRRLGRLIPFGFLRRAILRWLFRRLWFRRKLSGTFQVSCVPIDLGVAYAFNTAGCLVVGRVHDKVIPVDGAPAVRPCVTLTMSFDHKVWDGARMAILFAEAKKILEEGELDGETTS